MRSRTRTLASQGLVRLLGMHSWAMPGADEIHAAPRLRIPIVYLIAAPKTGCRSPSCAGLAIVLQTASAWTQQQFI
eukprot:3847527-Rhodomonas_salina.2